jgi:plasmid stabilization system protein ParE
LVGRSRPTRSRRVSPRPVEFHPAAEREALEAARWYGQHDAATAERFLWALDRAVALIGEAPERWPTYLHGTRRVLLVRYPFNLVNRIQSATVLVPQRLADLALPCRWSASASRKAVIASARGAACPETLPAPAPAPDLERTPWARGRRHAASKTREREKPAAFAGSPRSSHGPKAPLCPRTTDAPPRRTSGI